MMPVLKGFFGYLGMLKKKKELCWRYVLLQPILSAAPMSRRETSEPQERYPA